MEIIAMLKTIIMLMMLMLLSVDSGAQTESEKEKAVEKEKKKKPPEISTKVYNKVAPSLVKIECDNGNQIGTGTIVALNENGRAIILTACHVVAIDFENTPADSPLRFYQDVAVRLATDTTTARQSAVLKLYDRKKDLILIATRKPVALENVVINYNCSKHTGPGALVAAMGFPDSDKLSQTVGNIKRVEGGYFIFDANIAPGSSGGPLIDKYGRMVGMSRSTFEGEGYAVPLDSISTVVDVWLKNITPKRSWQRRKYGNFGQKMIRDWRFVLAELSLVGTLGYLSRPIEPDLPGPPGTP
jgi:S1-C subfamily serine protease